MLKKGQIGGLSGKTLVIIIIVTITMLVIIGWWLGSGSGTFKRAVTTLGQMFGG